LNRILGVGLYANSRADQERAARADPPLKHWSHQRGEHRAAEVRERLSLLDTEQRAAVASLLHYLQTRWEMAEATEILREWAI
jgi:hypothetical protein